MKRYNHILLILAVILFASCDDFLNEPPNKSDSVVPTTTEQLGYLFNGTAGNGERINEEGNKDLNFGSDDFGFLTRLEENNPGLYDIDVAHYATWDVEYLPVQDNRGYFSAEWKKIFTANLVLSELGNVTESENEPKEALKAEAHFIRAYSYYQMVNTYCLPYSAENMSELGLPIKESTSFEESAERVSLQETWDLIMSDLEKALELSRELKLVDAGYRTWRASTPAINAFAARVYLTMGDYTSALNYANKALADHSVMMDYNTDMRYSAIPTFVDDNTGTGNKVEILYPYTSDAQGSSVNMMAWKELYFYRFLSNGHWNYFASDELLALYDQTYDLRFKYHMVEDYSLTRGCSLSHPAYIFFFDKIPSGPTVAEMLLVKAECQARLGQWSEGMTTVNELRAKRMDNTAPVNVINLSASNQDEAIAQILEERRRELPFTQRMFDIRRYNNNSYAADDVTLTRNFYEVGEYAVNPTVETTYTLDKKSRKFARPIPQSVIDVTEGLLKQNTY